MTVLIVTMHGSVSRKLCHDRETYHYPLNIDYCSESSVYTLIVYCCTLLL